MKLSKKIKNLFLQIELSYRVESLLSEALKIFFTFLAANERSVKARIRLDWRIALQRRSFQRGPVLCRRPWLYW